MNIYKNSEVDRFKWIELLKKSEFSSPFQSPEFYELFNRTEGLSADVLAVEENYNYKALILVTIQKEGGLKGFFSLRGIVYGGPLVLSNEYDCLEHLLLNVRKYYKSKLIYLEIRNHFNYGSFYETFKRSNFTFIEHLNVQLSFKNIDIETALAGMNSTRRRQIRMTYKNGAFAREAINETEVAELFNILKSLYEKRVKLPLLPYDFFLNLYRSSIGKIFVAIHNDKIIGGAFCVYYINTSINTFYYADIRDYDNRIYPAHIAIKEAIDFGIKNKLNLLDFMGAGKPNTAYGVRDYKLQFGGNLVEHGRFLYIWKPLLYNVGKIGIKFLTKIK